VATGAVPAARAGYLPLADLFSGRFQPIGETMCTTIYPQLTEDELVDLQWLALHGEWSTDRSLLERAS
jgi:hypothetical protein